MSINLPLTEAAKDPEKYIPALEEIQQAAKDHLRGVSAALKEIRKIQAANEHLTYIQEHGVPRPREEQSADPGRGRSQGAGGSEGMSRKDLVVQLLRQMPDRQWKVRDIAAALGIENIKSLRTSLDEFARAGVIGKNMETSTYFLHRQGYQESLQT